MAATDRVAPTDAQPVVAAPEMALPGERVIKDPAQLMTVRLVDPGDGVLRVTISGEVDYVRSEMLLDVVGNSLPNSPRGVELDLSAVSFFDCSALNALLSLRRSARDKGAFLTVVRPAPVVRRVLDLTGTDDLISRFAAQANSWSPVATAC